MSIIIALASSQDGVVGSDGRMFGPARFDGGRVVKLAQIDKEDFKKTFSLYDGQVIGAFAGLMQFSGMTVAEHMSNILLQKAEEPDSLSNVVRLLKVEYQSRLAKIDEKGVSFKYRESDILLVGRKDLRRKNLRIIQLRFHPDNSGTEIICEETAQDRKHLGKDVISWSMFGDESAQKAARKLIDLLTRREWNLKLLEDLARDAILAGIAKSGLHPFGEERACGGEVFVEHCSY